MTNRTKTLGCAMIASVTLLVGCINTTPPAPSPTTTPSLTPTPTPSATPTPTLSVEQQAAANAVVKFYEVADQIAINTEVDLNSLYEVSGGELVQEYLKDLQMMRVRGWKQAGTTGVEVTRVNGGEEPYRVEACVDTSAIDVIDGAGKSLVAPGGSTRVLYNFEVVTLGSPVLRVTKAEVVRTPCD